MIGKNYTVSHSRKGKFNIHVIHEDSTYVGGRIIKGSADAFLVENKREAGDTIAIRKSLCSFTEINS